MIPARAPAVTCGVINWGAMAPNQQTRSIICTHYIVLLHSSGYLNMWLFNRSLFMLQCCTALFVSSINGSLKNKRQCHLDQNTICFFQENALRNVCCKIQVVLFRPPHVKFEISCTATANDTEAFWGCSIDSHFIRIFNHNRMKSAKLYYVTEAATFLMKYSLWYIIHHDKYAHGSCLL